jgi:hypothetical protein
MNTKATRIARSNVRYATYRRRKLLLVATYCLTSSLIAPTLHAAHCSTPKNDPGASTYLIQSALPFIGDRCVQIKPNESTPPMVDRVAKPSQTRATPSGDTK